jgi:hypothetical protein
MGWETRRTCSRTPRAFSGTPNFLFNRKRSFDQLSLAVVSLAANWDSLER